MSFLDFLLGRPLASDEARAEQVGVSAGIPIFGLDALSSAGYGPEAALTLLIPLGAAGISYIVPISASIIALLTIVYFSYRQTIQAYPGGGGSYTVARQNLGVSAGLLGAAALMIDYILVVAVGISAGVGALVSAVPSLQPRTLSLCIGILVIITLINLRCVRAAPDIKARFPCCWRPSPGRDCSITCRSVRSCLSWRFRPTRPLPIFRASAGPSLRTTISRTPSQPEAGGSSIRKEFTS